MTILVTLDMEAHHRMRLEAEAPQANFLYRRASAVLDVELVETDIIIGYIPQERLGICKHLKWLQLPMAGADQHAIALRGTGIVLTNASGAYGLAISEHMMAMTLCLMKKMHIYIANGQKKRWNDEGNVSSMLNATVLVVGMGDIGGEFAQRCKAMGSYVIGIRRVVRDKPDFVDEVATLSALDDLLPRADVVALSLPSTNETKQLFGSSRFEAMKQGSIFLNVGRGSAVNQDALCDALESGYLGGAGLDVTEPEPLPGEHRLWQAPNLIITPHVSGGYHMQETVERIVNICALNLRAYVAGKPLQNRVDSETGYRSIETFRGD